jgi:muramoyltetrapeptide carboxypeptidase
MSRGFAKVPALRPGSSIAVIAPSSPFDEAEFDRGVGWLRERYDVRYEDTVVARHGYLAGPDVRRLGELERWLADDDVDAIVAARGGYGATRLLEALDPTLVAARPKLLVGFSDVTALHALWARAGLRSIHGPMVAALGRAGPGARERWRGAVEGAIPETATALRTIAGGRAEGPLIGGNLAVLAALAGTPFAPPTRGAVLFLEDVGERPYRIDRTLTTLRHAGWLDRVAAVVIGQLSECEPGADGVTVDEVLDERLSCLDRPVVAGLQAGHVDDNLPLPLGARVVVDADAGVVRFEDTAVE